MDTYLYTEAPITQVEEIEEHGRAGEPAELKTGSNVPPGPEPRAGKPPAVHRGVAEGHGD